MKPYEQAELLKAVLALAAADGKITRSERGVYEALARRIGVGTVSLNAMVERACREPSAREELFGVGMSDPEHALELLVATARIDGEISEEERELLVHIASALGIEIDRFADVYKSGIARADTLRKR